MKRIAVLGMPNTGKSTFFNRLTGATASIGNWAGITVDLLVATLPLGGDLTEVIDLPGIYDLQGFSQDEAVVRRFLETTPVHLLVIILNAAQLDRQLSLALQVKHLGLPAVLLLNMADEAAKFGVRLETGKIAQSLQMPVIPISAKYGGGYEVALATITQALRQQDQPLCLPDLAQRLVPHHQLTPELEALLPEAVFWPEHHQDRLTIGLDRLLLHPVLGLPLFFAAMLLMFQVVYALGTPLQDGLASGLDWFKVTALEPLLASWPPFLQGFLIGGLYDGVGTVAAFIPVILLFFLCMAIVEDSGYLARSAFLMDAFMERLGLDGRSFVMSLMGFGCNVPAIMGTRVMRSPGLRLLSMLVIPFSLCSARLNVFIFMTTALFAPRIAPLVLFSLYVASFAAALITALLFKGQFPNQDPLVLELPPYRFPTLKQMVVRAWCEVRHFLRWSTRFIVAGVVMVWLLNHLPTNVPPASEQTLAGLIGQATQPFLAPLGIDVHLAIALIFGFIAKEIVLGGLAVIYGTSSDANLGHVMAQTLDWVQAYSFMLFTLLYVPCLSTVAVLRSEAKSTRFALLAVVWSTGLAWLASFVFYQSARALWPLP
ncbi:MAG TPA: ferrous iron transport protein B [Leptolyngbyaceae cyanobacterium M65_K2018_010]|nr:ferrous iron transport protein B [Leptolyngbyaceae cyanobacterium M65_K2018_010]